MVQWRGAFYTKFWLKSFVSSLPQQWWLRTISMTTEKINSVGMRSCMGQWNRVGFQSFIWSLFVGIIILISVLGYSEWKVFKTVLMFTWGSQTWYNKLWGNSSNSKEWFKWIVEFSSNFAAQAQNGAHKKDAIGTWKQTGRECAHLTFHPIFTIRY